MKFYRLVKPGWGQTEKANGDKNPNFQVEIPGPNIFEGMDFSPEFLKEKNEAGYSIFFFPNHPKESPYTKEVKFLNGRLIDQFNFCFVDVDLKDGVYTSVDEVKAKLKKFPITPTIFVESGHGCHVYFKIENLTRESYVALQLKLIKHFKSDESVFTVLQLMRLPGYMNTKNSGSPVKCEIDREISSGDSYMVGDLMKVLPELSGEEKRRGRAHLDRLDGKISVNIGRDVDLDELPDSFMWLMSKKPHLQKLFDDPGAGGDRSASDMKLCHFLYTEKFNVQESLAVMANTQKALEKGGNRFEYASLTVSKVFERRNDYAIESVTEFLNRSGEEIKEPLIGGPVYLDGGVLGCPWRKKEILGVISGSGIGKTAFCLNTVFETIKNNPNSNDVYVFISLEMTKGQIISRWTEMIGEDSRLADRLFVVDYRDREGIPFVIGLQEVFKICTAIKQQTGRDLGMIIIDHFHLISTHINTKEQPDFGIKAEQGTGWGDERNLSLNQVASQLKNLVSLLDTFLIVLAQTTKNKGLGDTPLYRDACYGVSNFDWICSNILTLFQPLMRIQDQTDLRVLAFQYAKIRELSVNDKIKPLEPKLLTYELKTGRLRGVLPEEYQEFLNLLPVANEKRKSATKNEGTTFSIVK